MGGWLEVDLQGLAKLLVKRGKAFALFELIQNSWDTDATEVFVSLKPIPGVPKASLVVEDDDPHGFQDISHAWTLFAESAKKADASKRGRFNLGEKLVLACCDSAIVSSTSGSVAFDKDGRHALRSRRERGSRFEATIRMTREEYAAASRALATLIP